MNIMDYITSEDAEQREEFENHVTNYVFDAFFKKLPQNPPRDELKIECPIWADGTEILCATEWLAETIADIIEEISGEGWNVRTGYYDPDEDVLAGEVDNHT